MIRLGLYFFLVALHRLTGMVNAGAAVLPAEAAMLVDHNARIVLKTAFVGWSGSSI